MGQNKFRELFSVTKPIIGMIHLAGNGCEKVKRALEELRLYEKEGIDGAIVENYHGGIRDVKETLRQVFSLGLKRIILGVNFLGNPYHGFELASQFGARFVQFDSVQTRDLNLKKYDLCRATYPKVAVLGGVRFKYQQLSFKSIEEDIREGREKCDAIVTTGEGTGKETHISKLREFKECLEDFPLIVGAGVNMNNVREQLSVADGAIVGTYFKGDRCEDTVLPVMRSRVRGLMDIVNAIRK